MAVDPYQIKPDVTSLDQDLQQLRRSKYDQTLADQTRHWIYTLINEQEPDGDLIGLIKDGVVLGKLANSIAGSKVVKYKESKMPFVQMENISNFLTFVRNYGVPADETFQTVDLFEEQDIASVLQTIISLSRYVNTKKPEVSVIGPKLSKKSPPVVPRKPNRLNDPSWSTFEYGYTKGASQSSEGVVFGNRRNIT